MFVAVVAGMDSVFLFGDGGALLILMGTVVTGAVGCSTGRLCALGGDATLDPLFGVDFDL